jgi:ATP citrate (pro-S)-lyase
MSAKAITEVKGKQLLSKYLSSIIAPLNVCSYTVGGQTTWDQLVKENPWLLTQKLVVKPDQLIKRRGKLGLVCVNVDLHEVKKWIALKAQTPTQVGRACGKLTHFIIEPFVSHVQSDEFYVCIYSQRDGETILFHHEGGVDVGDVDAKAIKINVSIDDQLKISDLTNELLVNVVNQKRKEMLTQFIVSLFEVYMDLHFTYLEINPLVCTDSAIYILDLASRIDQTADYLCKTKWGR